MLDWICPRLCLGCGANAEAAICPLCAPVQVASPHVHPGLFRGALCLGPYEGPLGRWIVKGKAGQEPAVLDHLGGLLGVHLGPGLRSWRPDVVVPVPSPWGRLLQRGYQPTARLAHPLAAALRLPVRHALAAQRHSSQAGLGPAARRRAAQARFALRRPVAGRVLLVDDVLTTGATAEACAALLLAGGAEAVVLITVVTTARGLSTRSEALADKPRQGSLGAQA